MTLGCGPPPLALPSQPLVPPGPPCAPRARTELLRTELAASCIQSQCGRTEPPREPRHQLALLAAAPRACGSGRRWFRGGVTLMRLTGQGTDPRSC